MSVLACLSQKGGVGKSALAFAIAATHVTMGWYSAIADFHPKQRTSTHLALRREENKILPAVMAIPCSHLYQVDDLACRNDLVVIDDGTNDEKRTFELALRSDLIVLPSSVTHDGLGSTIRFAEELIALGIDRQRLIFVFSLTLSGSKIALAHAKASVTLGGFTFAEQDIQHLTGYQLAMNEGRSLIETKYCTLNSRALALMREINIHMRTVMMLERDRRQEI